jgi:hypothetical protein
MDRGDDCVSILPATVRVLPATAQPRADVDLPPLPSWVSEEVAHQMREYARQAVLADRRRRS